MFINSWTIGLIIFIALLTIILVVSIVGVNKANSNKKTLDKWKSENPNYVKWTSGFGGF